MPKVLKAAIAAALLSAAVPAAAQAPEIAAFDATRAGSLADRLVLCDLGRYFETGPSRDARTVYVRRDNSRYELRIPPFVTWYDEDLERAYHRYSRAGLVTNDEIVAAERRYTLPMARVFDRPNLADRRFLEGQRDFCRDLSKAAPRG